MKCKTCGHIWRGELQREGKRLMPDCPVTTVAHARARGETYIPQGKERERAKRDFYAALRDGDDFEPQE
jgi:hypothetical protein